MKECRCLETRVTVANRLGVFFFVLMSLQASSALQLALPGYAADIGNATPSMPSYSPNLAAVSSVQPAPTPPSGSGLHWPRPYVYAGLFPSEGAGYSPAAGGVGTGLDWELPHLILLSEISAEDDHKLDSGTGTESHFLTRGFFRTERGWYFGGGVQWSNLGTIIYSKHAWRPSFGAGKDFSSPSFSARAQALYILPGTDHLNALQGPELSLWLPSPASQHHWFYRQIIGIYEFHQTSVPGNPGLNDRSVATFLEFTAMYRF
jgi:hypothetical protein